MRKLLPLALAVAALGAAGYSLAAPSPSALRGIVVGSHRGTLLVASPTGAVRALPGHVRIGMRVSLAGGKLRVLGRAHRALVDGVVLKRRGSTTFLSASNHVLLLRTVRALGSARDSRPAPGSVVQATVGIDDQGDLDEQNEDVVGQQPEVEVHAVVSAVAAGSVTLTVNGQQLVIPLPTGLTLPASLVGTQVELKLEFDEGVATVVPGVARDEDDDDDAAVTTTTTTTAAMTTTVAVVTSGHDGDGDGGHSGPGGGGHDGGGGDH
jgi:hypothetical protein